jgi:phosphoesterase RecJ-like protein
LNQNQTQDTIQIGFAGPESAVPIQEAVALLQERDDFLILCHQKPDGDAVGSAFALREALRSLGKRAQVACSDPFTPRYDFITKGEREPRRDFVPKTYVTVDIADVNLLGDKLDHLRANIDLAIDHHPSFTRFAALNVGYPSTAAAGEIVYHIIRGLGATVTPDIAAALYTAIATDTGCFKYSNVTPSALRVTAELVECGLRSTLHEINYNLFMLKTRTRMLLEARVVNEARFYREGKIAVAVVSLAMREELHIKEDDLDDLGTLMRCIEGVEVGVLMKETPYGSYRVSFRSVRKINVAAVAQTFGGGGHRRASGCTISGPLGQAEAALVAAIEQAYQEL